MSQKEISKITKENYKEIFKTNFSYLTIVSYRIIKDKQVAQDLVQEVFLYLWNNKDKIIFQSSVKAYLRKMTVNKTLNYIRAQKIKFQELNETIVWDTSSTIDQDESLDILKAQVHKAINELPNKCRIIFVLSRFEKLTYKEIAAKLEISPKTVEHQISKALASLRKKILEKNRG